MILIDDRVGSKEFNKYFENCIHPVDTETVRLNSADFCFDGNGPNGSICVGIERKTISDFVGSMETGRLTGHQLPLMLKEYDYSYIVLEGIWRIGGKSKMIEVLSARKPSSLTTSPWVPLKLSRHYSAKEVIGFMYSINIMYGVKFIETKNQHETADKVSILYHWFQKDWDKHKTGSRVYYNDVRTPLMKRPSFIVQVLAQFPGVGSDKAVAISKKFKRMSEIIDATPEEIAEVPGIGKKLSEEIWTLLH